MSSPNIDALNDINTLRDMIKLKQDKIVNLVNEIYKLRYTIECQSLELSELERVYEIQLKTKDENINP
jgi:hypothetical protein